MFFPLNYRASDASDINISILQITRAEEEAIIFEYKAAVPSGLIDSESVNLSDMYYLL